MVKVKSESKFLFFVFLIASLFYSSCIILPYRYHSGKGLISTSKVQPGITTKEDVLLELGNAFQKISDDERLFTATYSYNVEKGWFFAYVLAGGYTATGGAGTFAREPTMLEIYEVEIEFDDNDVVKRFETVKKRSLKNN